MTSDNAKRVNEHRKRSRRKGVKRIEVTAHERDVELVRALTRILRNNDEVATEIRAVLEKLLPKEPQNLVDFFRNSPLLEEDLEFERDKDTGREIDL